MSDDDRIADVRALLMDYVKSPSLRHIRDPYSVSRLASEIVKRLDRSNRIWNKWEGPRDALAQAAANCWVPPDDLRDCLNRLDGLPLTTTDVAQRLRAIHEEPYTSYPDERLQAGCLALYEAEKRQGTEMPAIIGALRDYVEEEEARLRREQEESYRRQQAEDRQRREQTFMLGADCGWIPVAGSKDLYCRRNGRAFRILQGKDKRWKLFRVSAAGEEGVPLGIYRGRGDANKALQKIAFEPEPRW